MKDFLLNNYKFFNLAMILIAGITGLIMFKKYRHTNVRYFIWFLFYVCVTELLGFYARILNFFGLHHIIENTVFKFDFWWHTLTWYVGAVILLVRYYRKLLKTSVLKTILKYALFGFIIISIVSIVTNFSQLFSGSFLIIKIGNISLIILSIIFHFYEILRGNKVLGFYKDIHFYISSILLIWLFLTIPLANVVCGDADTNSSQAELKWMIILYANMFMYLSFSVSLICLKPKYDLSN